MKYIFNILLIICCFGTCNLIAQETDSIPNVKTNQSVPELPGDEVEVIKNFRARLAETQRLQIMPEIPIFDKTTIPYFYEVNIRGLAIDYPPPMILPLALSPEPLLPNYNTFIKFGYGFPRYSVGQLNGSYRINDALKVGINYMHQAARHNKRYPRSFYEHVGGIFGELLLTDMLVFRAGLDIDLDKRQLVRRGDSLGEEFRATNQYMGSLGVGSSPEADSQFDYALKISFSNVGISDLDRSESWFRSKFNVGYRISNFGLKADIDYNFIGSESLLTDPLNSFKLSPRGVYNDDLWNARVGWNFLFENGSLINLPDISIGRGILGNKLHVRLFGESDIKHNSFHNILKFNPYINRLGGIRNEKTTRYGAGFSGIIETVEYKLEGGYKTIKDAVSYQVNSTNTGELILWNGTLSNATSPYVHLVSSAKVNNKVKLQADVLYQNLRDTSGLDILGTYDLEFGISSTINFADSKFLFTPKIRTLQNIARDEEIDHDGFFDLGVGLSYRVHEKVSIYIDSSNLLNNRNERWAGYEALGIMVNGGVEWRF